MHIKDGEKRECCLLVLNLEPGHSLLQDSMPDDEELDCLPSKRKLLR
jgi:hypothetical protein